MSRYRPPRPAGTALITPEGEVTDASTEEFLRNYMSEFHQFVRRVLTVLPRKG